MINGRSQPSAAAPDSVTTSTYSNSSPLHPWLIPLLVALALFGLTGTAQAQSPQAALRAEYQTLRPKLLHNAFGVPIYVQSREQNDVLTAEVYGHVDYPLQRIEAALVEPAGWCSLLALNLNVKACAHQDNAGQPSLTLYMGRKFYQPPEKAYPLRYRFQTRTSTPEYFEETLFAPDGPLGTGDYRITLQAVSVPGGALIHILSSYRSSATSRLATRIYLATLGKGKIGFSTTGVDGNGKPRYVEGVRGAIERNAMRHYLALQAVLGTWTLPAKRRFEASLQRWFALTEHYQPQLHEMDQAEYLQAKRREHLNQQQLQDAQTIQHPDDEHQAKLSL